MPFTLHSPFKPSGDQPSAIEKLVQGLHNHERNQVLLGVTGSGKTFTMANVIQQVQKPTLIMTHNKTLVAQLYGEFQQFFPDNAVEYFVSYYDYYQPEAYVPTTNTYIEKDLSINEDVEKLRLKTTTSLLSGRRDIIVVSSVSCIYGMGNPTDYKDGITRIERGQKISRNSFLHSLVSSMYARTTTDLKGGYFRVKGDTIDIGLPYADTGLRVVFFGDEIEDIESIEIMSGKRIATLSHAAIFPANIYMAPREILNEIIREIQDDLTLQINFFESEGKFLEAKRLKERTEYDLEMIKEMGYCSGIENYSRYFDRRKIGERPFCLIDYFPNDFLLILDESHVTVPQIGGMGGGDRARKVNLVEYGFRLPSALDNRPQSFNEFEQLISQAIFVSATPADYELNLTGGEVVEQIVRPTGLLDPPIDVRPSLNQIDDLLDEINETTKRKERTLVTTLTKRMAEELSKFLLRSGIKCRYIHSEVDTLQRVEILRDLRLGVFDVLIGVNLLREGLDLPEVSLVAILDADKEGFLRNHRSLTQTAGRAARNANGRVIMYADNITKSMQKTIDETNRRREKQIAYNIAHNIVPKTVYKSTEEIYQQTSLLNIKQDAYSTNYEEQLLPFAAEEETTFLTKEKIEKQLKETKKKMEKAAMDMEFILAAQLRDKMYELQEKLKAY